MDRCDVLIVGGGPAGSSCAGKLRAAGLDVCVLDKKKFPRDKVCAGWITPAVLESLHIDAHDYARGRVFQPITGFRISTLGEPEVCTDYDEPVSYGIRRCEFDHYLLQRAGARLRLGEGLESIERSGKKWVINGSIEAAMLIGAGGHFCPVARHLGAKSQGAEVVVAAQEIEFEMTPAQIRDCPIRAEVPELFFCPDLAGYAWCFRKGSFLNVGLGREDNRALADHVQAFLARLKAAGRVPADTPEKFHGHAYILYGHTPRKMLDDSVVLIGDAAGLAYPQSGEGIRAAVESGLIAADTIAHAEGDYSVDRLAPYAARLIARLGKPKTAEGWAALIPTSWKEAAAARLLANHWFARHIVLDRWFLHRQQPALAV